MLGKKIAGASISSIARDEGLSRTWVAAELASDDCRQIVIGLVNAHLPLIERLFHKSLTVIDEALDATRTAASEGGVLDLGPDHFARLAGLARFLDLVRAGRPAATIPDESKTKKGISLEQLREAVRIVEAGGTLQ